jgi:hypothetical protein
MGNDEIMPNLMLASINGGKKMAGKILYIESYGGKRKEAFKEPAIDLKGCGVVLKGSRPARTDFMPARGDGGQAVIKLIHDDTIMRKPVKRGKPAQIISFEAEAKLRGRNLGDKEHAEVHQRN